MRANPGLLGWYLGNGPLEGCTKRAHSIVSMLCILSCSRALSIRALRSSDLSRLPTAGCLCHVAQPMARALDQVGFRVNTVPFFGFSTRRPRRRFSGPGCGLIAEWTRAGRGPRGATSNWAAQSYCIARGRRSMVPSLAPSSCTSETLMVVDDRRSGRRTARPGPRGVLPGLIRSRVVQRGHDGSGSEVG
jgi:hypothetical protein